MKPKVMLLGDSVRMRYQPLVVELLADDAQVVAPVDNCRFALYTQARLATWLEELGDPAVVHWNNGLWDTSHNQERGPVQFSVADYIRNLRTILDQLRSTKAKVIWATTTPVHPDRPFAANGTWHNGQIEHYNAAACDLMNSQNVPINDLHAIIDVDHDALIHEDQLHLSDEGSRRCAHAVADAVRSVLNGQT